MSCYFRHMKTIMDEAGIEITLANKKQVDQAIHKAVGVGYKDCSATWKKIKQEILNDDIKRQEFLKQLHDIGA